MPVITVDPKLCGGDEICCAVCTAGVFAPGDGGVSSVVAPELCNLCGHCLAACPRDAISHSEFSLADFPRRPHDLPVSPADLTLLLRARRSIRKWHERPVPRQILEQLIDLGRFAPTASNAQDVGFVVVRDREQIRELDRLVVTALAPLATSTTNPPAPNSSLARFARRLPRFAAGARDLILHEAPALIVLHAPARLEFGDEDCHYAAMHMMALAETLGLGTCLMGWLIRSARRSPEIMAALGLPATQRVGTAFTVGYPRYRYKRLAGRNAAQVTWL